MRAAGTSQMTEKLPPELLEEILRYVSVPDIIKLNQINRGFRDFIRDSPYIKHRIDLFAAGWEDNPFASSTFANRKKAYDEHRTKWETLKSTRKWQRTVDYFDVNHRVNTAGIYAFLASPEEFVDFIALESVSRGIPRKEWRLPLPDLEFQKFAINPHANLLVFIVQKNPNEYALHLLSMTTGQRHPAAKNSIITYPRTYEPVDGGVVHDISITNSRLAVLAVPLRNQYSRKVVVWDWRAGRILLDQANQGHLQLEFVDEHSLLLLSDHYRGDPLRLHIFDTEQGTIDNPIQTTFYFSPDRGATPYFRLSTESCGHIPSPDELTTAPFYSDPSQRILTFYPGELGGCYVVYTELLLKLARERKGQNVGWKEWAPRTFWIPVGEDRLELIRVSWCRLFFVETGNEDNVVLYDGYDRPRFDGPAHLRMYDFSHTGRVRHLHVADETRAGVGPRRISPSLVWVLPWNCSNVWDVTIGHDNIVFCIDNPSDEEFDPADREEIQLHVWSF